MNINQYKVTKIKEIDYFLRGIHPENIGIKDKKIITGLTPECSDFFNKDGIIRTVTENILNKINGLKETLINTDIEFASSEEEINQSLIAFVNTIRNEIDNYKHIIIKIMFQSKIDDLSITELQEVKEKNKINTGLNFIKIKIGNNLYLAKKTDTEAQEEIVDSDDITQMFICVYLFIDMIKDKEKRKENLIDLNSATFKTDDPRYEEIRTMIYKNHLNIKDYDKYVHECNDVEEQIVTGQTKITLINEIKKMLNLNNDLNDPKYIKIISEVEEALQSNKYKQIKAVYQSLIKYLTEKETKSKRK